MLRISLHGSSPLHLVPPIAGLTGRHYGKCVAWATPVPLNNAVPCSPENFCTKAVQKFVFRGLRRVAPPSKLPPIHFLPRHRSTSSLLRLRALTLVAVSENDRNHEGGGKIPRFARARRAVRRAGPLRGQGKKTSDKPRCFARVLPKKYSINSIFFSVLCNYSVQGFSLVRFSL